MLRTIELADKAQHTIFRILDDCLFAFFVRPDNIGTTTVDTYTAAIAQGRINTLNSHSKPALNNPDT
jgi:hypothetical protein